MSSSSGFLNPFGCMDGPLVAWLAHTLLRVVTGVMMRVRVILQAAVLHIPKVLVGLPGAFPAPPTKAKHS